jgi:protein-S-isoprenylcysteine O-methyltransferase Ste14
MNDVIKSWLFVLVQGALLVALLFMPSAPDVPRPLAIIGEGVQLIGVIVLILSLYDLRKSLTALPLPTRNGQLQVRGLYRFVRHPMYVGVLTLSLGVAISGNTLLHYLLVAALYALFTYKARYEEQLLITKYPGYSSYMKKTPRFIPGLRNS